jgi:hypothetical protein
MKVKDLFNTDLDICVDVYENIADLISIAFCGSVQLTDEGKKHFAKALQFPIARIDKNMLVIDTEKYYNDKKINLDKYDFEEKIPKGVQNLIDLFWSVAGYCSTSDYENWFVQK